MKSKVFFLHIPKCAGASVWHALRYIYGRDNVFQVGIEPAYLEFEAMSLEKRRSFDAIGGHRHLPTFQSLLGDLSTYFCFVTFREPVARIVSEFNFTRSFQAHLQYERVKSMSFEQFVNEYVSRNMQTVLLCGAPPADARDAIEILDKNFDYWCLMEEASMLIRLLHKRAGKKPQPFYVNRSEGEVKVSEIAPLLLTKIRELNAIDIDFYNRIVSRRKRLVPRLSNWWRNQRISAK